MEEEKKKIRVNFLIFLLIIIMVITISIFIYILNLNKTDRIQNEVSELVKQDEIEENSELNSIKIYEDKPYVFTKEEFNSSDSTVPNFELPFINIKGESVEIVNEKINNIYNKAKAKITEDDPNGISYRFSTDTEKDILKIVLYEGYGAGESSFDYYRFYIDMKNGKELTNKELLNEYGFNESNIQEEYDKIIRKYYDYILSHLEGMVYSKEDFENVSFEMFYSNLKVLNKNTKKNESFKYENINYYEIDFDMDNKDFVINNMVYKGKEIGVDGQVMFSW